MPLDTAIRGENVTCDVFFYNVDGITPFPGIGGAVWVVRSQSGALINNGIGQQDPTNVSHWVANFSIPRSAPTTANNERYSITWRISNSKQSQTATEYFQVTDTLIDTPVDGATTAMLGGDFNASLVLPYSTLNSLSLRVLDDKGYIHLTTPSLSNTTAISSVKQSGNNYIYNIPISTSPTSPNYLIEQGLPTPLPTGNQGIPPRCWFNPPRMATGYNTLYCYWNITTADGDLETIVNPLYLADARAVALMNDVRRYVDRIRNSSAIPQLRITDTDLLHFVVKGLEDFNAIPPSNSGGFGLSQLPAVFTAFVRKLAIIELLQAQYLAEGATMFNFTGQSVTLDVDQTQYLMTIIQDLQTEVTGLGSMASMAKNHYIRSGGLRGAIATIGGNLGPVSNWTFRVPYAYGVGGMGLNFGMLPFL